jgi:transposase
MSLDQEKAYLFYVGIDWGMEEYQVCVIDGTRSVLLECRIKHIGPALAQFAQDLARFAPGHPEKVAIAIEVSRGAIVEMLLEHGFHVFALNPKQMDRFRDRHTVAGAKDDRRDAFVQADSLRTDLPCFRRIRVDGPLVIQLREMARVGEELGQEMNRLTNRLREQLHRFYPQMLRLCPAADGTWLWDLLKLAPSPAETLRLQPGKVEELLRRHRIRRFSAMEVLAEIRTPPLQLAPGSVEACIAHVRSLLSRLRFVHTQQRSCSRSIDTLLKRLHQEGSTLRDKPGASDVAILLSMKGLGKITAVTLLTEASFPLAERDYETLRALAGVAPVTRRSGKDGRKQAGKWGARVGLVIMRRACNLRLRNAVYHWARVSAQRDEESRNYYETLRKKGHNHARALRSVADRLMRILIACLRNGTPYDPERLRRRVDSSKA